MSGKVAIVTGGADGIGAATARAFANAGIAVMIGDISPAGAALAQALTAAGQRASFIETDVRSPAACQALVDACLAQYGRLDIAANNVGKVDRDPGVDNILTPQAWDDVISISLSSLFYCIRAELEPMLAAGGGAIINMSSVAGLVSLPRKLAYVSAKHGVIGLTKAVCDTYGDRNIRCNAIAPGLIETPGLRAAVARGDSTAAAAFAQRTPMRRMGIAEEVAAAALWLSSDAAGYVNGAVLPVDGGYLVR